MTVWVVIHYDWGCTTLRGVYATREVAVEACTDRTPSGRPSQAIDAHSEHCCKVEAREVGGAV